MTHEVPIHQLKMTRQSESNHPLDGKFVAISCTPGRMPQLGIPLIEPYAVGQLPPVASQVACAMFSSFDRWQSVTTLVTTVKQMKADERTEVLRYFYASMA